MLVYIPPFTLTVTVTKIFNNLTPCKEQKNVSLWWFRGVENLRDRSFKGFAEFHLIAPKFNDETLSQKYFFFQIMSQKYKMTDRAQISNPVQLDTAKSGEICSSFSGPEHYMLKSDHVLLLVEKLILIISSCLLMQT